MVTDSEDDSPEYDSEDEDEDGGDEYIDDAFGMYPPSPIPNSGGIFLIEKVLLYRFILNCTGMIILFIMSFNVTTQRLSP